MLKSFMGNCALCTHQNVVFPNYSFLIFLGVVKVEI